MNKGKRSPYAQRLRDRMTPEQLEKSRQFAKDVMSGKIPSPFIDVSNMDSEATQTS